MELLDKIKIGAGLAVAGLAVYAYFKAKDALDSGGGFFQTVGAGVASAAVDAVDGVVSGAALTVGDAIGVPRTNRTECQKALDEGRTWDASFACPAGDFIKSFF